LSRIHLSKEGVQNALSTFLNLRRFSHPLYCRSVAKRSPDPGCKHVSHRSDGGRTDTGRFSPKSAAALAAARVIAVTLGGITTLTL
jgi:hypothetical protein